MSDFIIGLTGTIVGSVITFLTEKNFRNKDNKEKVAHFSSLLYYDLKSIEYYLKNERTLVNIRYSSEWQNMISECRFLNEKFISYIYKIYDNVYNYNYHFNARIKQGGSFRKEDIGEFEKLKKCSLMIKRTGLIVMRTMKFI